MIFSIKILFLSAVVGLGLPSLSASLPGKTAPLVPQEEIGPVPGGSPPQTTAPENAPEPASEPAPQNTEFEGDHAEMQTLENETRFLLTGNVKVTGNDLVVFCDRLEVYALRGGPRETEAIIGPGGIQRIVAIGNVRVEQEGRQATAGRAEVFPQEGRIVLTESPELRDEQGFVSGERITFIQGEGARVERGERGPVRITLPALPALDTGRSSQNREETPGDD